MDHDNTMQAMATAEPSPLTDLIIAALRTVHDPEIPVNIYDLGLIYRITPDPDRSRLSGRRRNPQLGTKRGSDGRRHRPHQGQSCLQSAVGQIDDVGRSTIGAGLCVTCRLARGGNDGSDHDSRR
jgi:hypothetical protein